MHIYYYTFGCKVNQYETENIRQALEAKGHKTVTDIASAEVCVINTCTVTEEADKKLIQLINRVKKANSDVVTVLCGCYSQVSDKAHRYGDIVVGTANKTQIPMLIDAYFANKKKIISVSVHAKGEKIERMANAGTNRKTRAVIKIQDGCDRFCTYCIIPYARGRVRSKPLDEIEKEAKALVAAGHKELDVVGINLSCYGKEWGLNLADAVERVCLTSGAERVRLGSLEPELLTEDIIKRLASFKSLCPHFHLSLQSGCDKTLKEMGRLYDKSEYFTIVKAIRRYFPDCAITTDIMVGFAGEAEDDFCESLEFVKQVKFADAHVFPYSERQGTAAAKRIDQISPAVKAKRARIMIEAVKSAKREYLQSIIGKTVSVLFEKEKDKQWHIGHSENYTVVKVVHFTDTLRYEIRDVLIERTDGEVCYGRIV